MLQKRFLIPIAIALLTAGVAASASASFGTVVPIGGTASDICLDEGRGVLYIANLGGNTIQVMSLADNSIHTSINVAANPISMSLSPDGQYLLVAHYGNWTAADPNKNRITLIRLADNVTVTYNTFDPPLGVAFVSTGKALIVTTTSFLLFDPVSGQISVITTMTNVSVPMPVAFRAQQHGVGGDVDYAATLAAAGQRIGRRFLRHGGLEHVCLDGSTQRGLCDRPVSGGAHVDQYYGPRSRFEEPPRLRPVPRRIAADGPDDSLDDPERGSGDAHHGFG